MRDAHPPSGSGRASSAGVAGAASDRCAHRLRSDVGDTRPSSSSCGSRGRPRRAAARRRIRRSCATGWAAERADPHQGRVTGSSPTVQLEQRPPDGVDRRARRPAACRSRDVPPRHRLVEQRAGPVGHAPILADVPHLTSPSSSTPTPGRRSRASTSPTSPTTARSSTARRRHGADRVRPAGGAQRVPPAHGRRALPGARPRPDDAGRRLRAAHRQRPVAQGRRLGVLLRRRPAHPRPQRLPVRERRDRRHRRRRRGSAPAGGCTSSRCSG